MKKLFVSNLPSSTNEDSLQTLFAQFGRVHSLKLVKDLFSGRCKGIGFLEMEGHEARAAIAGLDGKEYEGKYLKVRFEQERPRGAKARRRH